MTEVITTVLLPPFFKTWAEHVKDLATEARPEFSNRVERCLMFLAAKTVLAPQAFNSSSVPSSNAKVGLSIGQGQPTIKLGDSLKYLFSACLLMGGVRVRFHAFSREGFSSRTYILRPCLIDREMQTHHVLFCRDMF